MQNLTSAIEGQRDGVFERSATTALRLFCFPYSGGSAAMFREWPDELPTNVEVRAVQLPGHGTRLAEEPCTDLRQLVSALARELETSLDVQFAFYGHSLGALVSFELARTLRERHGMEPCHLLVSGYPAPQLPNNETRTHDLSDEELIAYLCRLNGIPKDVSEHAEMMKLWLPVLRADLSICQTYAYTPADPLNCPVTVFGGTEDEKVNEEELKQWKEQTRGAFSLQMLPGDHFFLHSAQGVLLRRINRALLQHTRPHSFRRV